jgi:hypothetical protein
MNDERYREELEVEPDELNLLQEYVADTPGLELEVIQEAEPGIAPLLILGIIGAASLVAGAVTYLADMRRGGQVIDLREGHDLAKRSREVIYGYVLIIAADGKVSIEVHEPKNFFAGVIKDVLEAVQNIATKTMETAAEAAKAAVGNRGSVTTEPGSD